MANDGGWLTRKDILATWEAELTKPLMSSTFLLYRWPYGVIVQSRQFDDVKAMVLVDDGTLCTVVTLRLGEIAQTGRSIWEPVP